ncbi:MAG: hypothetical protein R3D84_09480 [Paracoccaceae bacterium]
MRLVLCTLVVFVALLGCQPGAKKAELPPVGEDLVAAMRTACEADGGSFQPTSNGTMACVRFTRDGGKQCDRASQCQGDCLARSGTCAPITPLFGCQEIFQDDGTRITECVQ